MTVCLFVCWINFKIERTKYHYKYRLQSIQSELTKSEIGEIIISKNLILANYNVTARCTLKETHLGICSLTNDFRFFENNTLRKTAKLSRKAKYPERWANRIE